MHGLPLKWRKFGIFQKYIHANPELGFQEEKACRIQCEYLKQKGF